ncbi:MAG: hypothetical protein HFJ02_02945 [Bacilli bacterium]|nr:hypothetical protein [Bacilli bacterium]
MRLTKRFIVKSLDKLELSPSIRYERYYINKNLRIQKKEDKLEKEILNNQNELIEKILISNQEFEVLKSQANQKIIRDSYLYLKDERVSIKKYLEEFSGLNRVKVKFSTKEELESYQKELWMGKEITSTPLAFDKDLCKLTQNEFLKELTKALKE